ncbi:MAG TPA: hypothetical protein VG894_07195 [Bauldia sp.]|nr:hypothetical protein [Bauldia sp.]
MSDKLSFIHGLLTRSQGRVTRNFARRISALPAERCPDAKLAIRIDALLQVRAALDASIALLGYDLPDWSVRSLMQDGDGWHCLLSRNPALPEELDDVASGDGPTPARAILAAMTAARCADRVGDAPSPAVHLADCNAPPTMPGVSCDDYA